MSKTKVFPTRIKPMVEKIVERKVIELLGDPDMGLELRRSIRKRLKKSLATRTKTISANKVVRILGLKW